MKRLSDLLLDEAQERIDYRTNEAVDKGDEMTADATADYSDKLRRLRASMYKRKKRHLFIARNMLRQLSAEATDDDLSLLANDLHDVSQMDTRRIEQELG